MGFARAYDQIAGTGPSGKFFAACREDHNHRIIGEVEIIRKYKDGNGESLFTHIIDYNDLLLNGSVYFLEKINNFRSSFTPKPLDVQLGVHRLDQIIRDNSTIGQEVVGGIVIGVDGCTNTYNTVKPVQRHHDCVPGIIPFRVTTEGDDLVNGVRSKYFLRAKSTINQDAYVCYYGKRFEKSGEIKVMFEDGTDVPLNAATLRDPKFMRAYAEYTCMIDHADVRDWFKLTTGSTITSRVNSVGLVAGYPSLELEGNGQVDKWGNPIQDVYEYNNVRCLTTLNMENQELKDSSSTIKFVYRLIVI